MKKKQKYWVYKDSAAHAAQVVEAYPGDRHQDHLPGYTMIGEFFGPEGLKEAKALVESLEKCDAFEQGRHCYTHNPWRDNQR